MDNQSLQLMLAFGRMLGGYGQDTGKGMDWGIPAEAMMGNIRAQGTAAAQRKWMEWFQQFLGPDESKATLSNKGITMSLPGSDLGSIFQGTQKGGVWEGMAPPLGAPKIGTGGRSKTINPFSSSLPEFSASDLAGLTPEDISSALAGPLSAVGMKQKLGLEREQLAGKSVQDVFDMMYKGQLMRESEHRIKKGEEPDPLDRPHPLSIPKSDGSPMTIREFNTLTPKQKELLEYRSEVSKGKDVGESMLKDLSALTEAQTPAPASFREWKAAKDVSGYTGTYEQWEKDPSDWYEFKRAKSEGGFVGNYKQWKEHLAALSQKDREPAPMTWTTATQELTKRYGKLDPTGMWAVTPELQSTHRKAQAILNEYRESKMHPLKAINEAENAANTWKTTIEKRYQEFIDKAAGDKDAIAKINSAFYNKYGYLPTLRR